MVEYSDRTLFLKSVEDKITSFKTRYFRAFRKDPGHLIGSMVNVELMNRQDAMWRDLFRNSTTEELHAIIELYGDKKEQLQQDGVS